MPNAYRVSFDGRDDVLVVTDSESFDHAMNLCDWSVTSHKPTKVQRATEEILIDPALLGRSAEGAEEAIRRFEERKR